MTFTQRIETVSKLGRYLREACMQDALFLQVAENSVNANPFFRLHEIKHAADVWGGVLTYENLQRWLEPYSEDLRACAAGKNTVRIIMAGNIPLVGFHDYLCACMCGWNMQVQLSRKDAFLLPFLHEKLNGFGEPDSVKVLWLAPHGEGGDENVPEPDAVIATGGEDAHRYFEYRYGKYPRILRGHRNGCAVLDGTETEEELKGLASDILLYSGLGCRSISKIFTPAGYDFSALTAALQQVGRELGVGSDSGGGSPYMDNYRWQKAVFTVGGQAFTDAGCVLLQESEKISSPLAVVYYEPYTDLGGLLSGLEGRAEQIQCITGHGPAPFIPFGSAQRPDLNDYADDVDTMAFLLGVGNNPAGAGYAVWE